MWSVFIVASACPGRAAWRNPQTEAMGETWLWQPFWAPGLEMCPAKGTRIRCVARATATCREIVRGSRAASLAVRLSVRPSVRPSVCPVYRCSFSERSWQSVRTGRSPCRSPLRHRGWSLVCRSKCPLSTVWQGLALATWFHVSAAAAHRGLTRFAGTGPLVLLLHRRLAQAPRAPCAAAGTASPRTGDCVCACVRACARARGSTAHSKRR